MADLKVGEAYIATCYIVDLTGAAATGLAPTSILIRASTGTRTTPAVTEISDGVYKVTVTATNVDTWNLTISVAGNYSIYGAVHEIKVGGGNVGDIETALGAEFDGTPDLYDVLVTGGIPAWAAAAAPANNISISQVIRAIYDDSNELQTDWVNGGRLDLLIDGIIADIGVFPSANYATLAAYVEDIRSRLIVILADVTGINGDAMRGTDNAALAASWTAALATALGSYTAVRAGYLDELAAANIPTDLTNIYNLVDAILDLTETGGTLAATGGEDTIYLANAPSGVWEPRHVLIDLTNMAGVDDITIRIYYRIKTGGNLILQYEQSYLGPQTVDLWEEQLIPNRYGVQVTLEQTAGVNRNYDWEVLYNG